MAQTVQKIEISHRTVIFTVFFLIALYVLYLIRDIIGLVFISILFMTAISPLVERLERYKVPRGLSIAIIYILVLASLIGIIVAIVPPLVSQTDKLISQIPIPPGLTDSIRNIDINLQDLEVIANQLNSIPKLLNVFSSAFSFVLVLVTIGVISYYLLKERAQLHQHLSWLFGNNQAEKRAEDFINRVEAQIGGWVRGESALMLIVGGMTYIGLLLLNISFAAPLALIAGLLEILPNIGPTVAAVPAIAVALFTASPAMALAVLALYILVQQLENNFIVPMVMKRATGLNPIVTIILVLVGFRLGGAAGGALAIPIFLVTKVTVAEFTKLKNL